MTIVYFYAKIYYVKNSGGKVNLKKLLALILALLMVATFIVACSDEDSSSSSSSSSGTDSSSSSSSSSSSTPTDDNPPTTDAIPTIDYNVNVNQSFNSNTFNIDSFGNTDLASSYPTDQTLDVTGGLKITTPGTYRIIGVSTKDGIEVDISRADKSAPLQEVVLILDGVQITNSADASLPPIYSKGCDLKIVLLKDKRNIIFDNRVINDQTSSEKGTVYVKTGNLTIEGEGELKIETKYKNAIYCTKSILINGGIFNLTSNYHGIYAAGEKKSTDNTAGLGGLTIKSGDFTINSTRSALKTGDYDETSTPVTDIKAALVIEGGKFQLKSGRNAIDAYGELIVKGGGFNIDSSADGLNASDKVSFVGDGSTVMIISSKDSGIKSDAIVSIAGKANVKITSKTDGIKANDIEIDTTGVVYIVTEAEFEENQDEGEYIRDADKVYHKVSRNDYPKSVFYSVKGSSKGIDAANKVEIKNGIVAICSVEEAIVTSDGKNVTDPAKTVNTITISGGSLTLDTKESAIKADNTIAISGTSTSIAVYRSDKGLNANEITIANAKLAIISISDAIDAKHTTVSSGTVYLFDKVDIPTGGTFTVNGGVVACISTTKSPVAPTTTAYKTVSANIQATTDYVYGNCVNIKGAGVDLTLAIPKSYVEKVSVTLISADVTAGEYTISVGTYNGSPSFFEYKNGTFTAKSTQAVAVQ